MDIVTRLRVEAQAYERHAVPDSYEKSLHDDLTEAADTIEAQAERIRVLEHLVIVAGDDASVSLVDQRARSDARMTAARAAISKAEGK